MRIPEYWEKTKLQIFSEGAEILFKIEGKQSGQDTVILIRRPAMETKPVLEKGLKFPVWNEAVFLLQARFGIPTEVTGKRWLLLKKRWLTLNWIIWICI